MWSKGECFRLSRMILVKWRQGEGKGSLKREQIMSSSEWYLEWGWIFESLTGLRCLWNSIACIYGSWSVCCDCTIFKGGPWLHRTELIVILGSRQTGSCMVLSLNKYVNKCEHLWIQHPNPKLEQFLLNEAVWQYQVLKRRIWLDQTSYSSLGISISLINLHYFVVLNILVESINPSEK